MVNNCANPDCHKPLHYLREGKVYLFSRRNSPDSLSALPHQLEHFWLCGNCVRSWTLAIDRNGADDQIKLVKINRRHSGAKFETMRARAS